MAIVPDDKDWTWVIERRCSECGFDGSALAFAAVPDLVRENAAAWPAVLSRPDVAVRHRPDRWSALEYGCHVRDVYRLYHERLVLMLETDGVHYPNWDQDEAAIAERYNEQDPNDVGEAISANAATIADALAAVDESELSRTGYRSDGAHFTIDTFARYFIHDPIHHLWDVTSGATEST